jgi:large subunit ribosomal protein L17
MRHAKKRLQLSRFTSWHDATIRSLARNMVICQSINTTLTRAKASKQMIEKLITLGKKNTLFARRQAQKVLGEHKLVNVLFNEIAPRFAKRNSGFTRIIGLGKRRGDNAETQIAPTTEEVVEDKIAPEQKKETKAVIKENPADQKKPQKKFMGGLRTIFKKKSDSL